MRGLTNLKEETIIDLKSEKDQVQKTKDQPSEEKDEEF